MTVRTGVKFGSMSAVCVLLAEHVLGVCRDVVPRRVGEAERVVHNRAEHLGQPEETGDLSGWPGCVAAAQTQGCDTLRCPAIL